MARHLFLFILAGIFAFRTAELPIGAGIPLAELKLKDVSGKEINLKEASMKNGLLVMFSCNTCPYVIKNQERTKAICSYARDHNIGVVLVNSNEADRTDGESMENMKQYASAQGYQWFYVIDKGSEMANAFDARRTPENFLFSSDGKLVYHGAIDDNPSDADHVTRRHLREAIDELLNGKEITVKTSRSVGCSIKRL
jgi:hypothetical protein